MAAPILNGLRNLREDLLRQLVLSSGSEKVEIVNKIIEMDEMIALEEKALLPTP
jgi:hypothetical protein